MSACRRHYPGRSDGTDSLGTAPSSSAFPTLQLGQLLHYQFRGLFSVHSRYDLQTRQVALRDPLHRRLRRLCCLHRRSDCYRVERSSSRAGLSSRCGPALFTAHCNGLAAEKLTCEKSIEKATCQSVRCRIELHVCTNVWLSLITGAIATILLCNYLRRNRHEKIVVGHAALGQLSARARKQSQQPEPEQLEDFERRHNGTGLRRQIYWRLHTDEAGPRYDLSTSGYWQNKTKPLSGSTSGGDRKGITLAENELQLISKGGSGLGSFNHHLDQDHREGMLRPIANLS
jgi:hypothetical protein